MKFGDFKNGRTAGSGHERALASDRFQAVDMAA
jgi:hypothetical protein